MVVKMTQDKGLPMTLPEKRLIALIREVRTCFNQLKTLAEHLHEDLGVNPSMRAVMESLVAIAPQTVPDIARSKGVSRQHIQTIMNVLLDADLVASADNPAHKRSPLFALTAKGQTIFATMGEREKEPVRRLAASLPLAALDQAEETLQRLNRQLEAEIAKGETHE